MTIVKRRNRKIPPRNNSAETAANFPAMNKRFFQFLSVVALQGLLGASSFACGLNWSLPVNHFENVNPQGKFSYWQKVGEIDVGGGLKLPLHLNFRGDRFVESPGLGVTGFMLGLTDSSIVAVDERRFLLQTPAGRYRIFQRDRENPNILRSSSQWVGEIKGETITVTSECGNRLTYRKGFITQMALKDRVFDYVYYGGKPVEIREKGIPVFLLKYEGKSLVVQTRGNKQLQFFYGERPCVQHIAGQNVIGKIEKTLAKMVDESGEETNFQFGVTSDVRPTLAVGDVSFTWNPATGEMIQDGEWIYDIKPGERPRDNAAIGRANVQGQKEFWYHDKTKGEEIVQGIDGVKKITTWFTRGKLAGKIRKIEKNCDGKVSTCYQASYGENGKLIRELIGNLIVNYRQSGDEVTKVATDTQGVLWTKKYRDGRLTNVEIPGTLTVQIEHSVYPPKTDVSFQ